MSRVHLFGASGSGTTTLGHALAEAMGWPHFDTDSFYWMPTEPPFQQPRELSERQALLLQALESSQSWTLSGSLCGWGDFTIPMFDLAVFLSLPTNIRMERIKQRELQRYGASIFSPNDTRYPKHQAFLSWAAKYDTAGLNMRSRARHKKWMQALSCPVIHLDSTQSVAANLDELLACLEQRHNE